MPPSSEQTLHYWVSSLRVRRELIPVHEGGRLVAYRCVTHRADGPVDGVDKVIADQVEFEDELIRLKLMAPRDIARVAFAGLWRFVGADRIFETRPQEGEPLETLLRLL